MAEESWEAKENAVVQCMAVPGGDCNNGLVDDFESSMSYNVWNTITVTDGLFDQARPTKDASVYATFGSGGLSVENLDV